MSVAELLVIAFVVGVLLYIRSVRRESNSGAGFSGSLSEPDSDNPDDPRSDKHWDKNNTSR